MVTTLFIRLNMSMTFYDCSPYNKTLNLFRFLLIKIFIFDNPFGISTSISLNSLINGGNTRIKIVNTINEITVKTRNKESDRGIFKPFWIWLHKLQTIFEITKEQIIKRRKSLKVHIINEVIKITTNLKYDELLNFQNILLLLRIS